MKKFCFLIISVISMMLPASVFAFELKCDEGIHNPGTSFGCTVERNPDEFDIISGTLEYDEGIECSIEEHDQGLYVEEEKDTYFKYSGQSISQYIVKFKCKVTSESPTAFTTKAYINDFKYKAKDAEKQYELVLRSENINIGQYVKEEDKKPRGTSNPNSLATSIRAENLDITFSRFITEYETEVLFEVEELKLDVKPLNSEANVTITGDTKLKVGSNVIDVYVESPDGKSTTCYTIYVTRKARGEEIYNPNEDSKLKALTITGFAINFDPNKYEYTIHLLSTQDSLIINPTPNYELAKVDISKSDKLKHGDRIVITVTNKNGTDSTKYIIKITKDAEKKDYSSYFILGGLTLGVIAIIGLVMYTNNKKMEKDPVLQLKLKQKKNKGKKIDANEIPDVATPINEVVTPIATPEPVLPQVTEPVVQQTVVPQEPVQQVIEQQNVVQQVQPIMEQPQIINQEMNAFNAQPVIEQPQVLQPVEQTLNPVPMVQQPVEQIQPVQPVQEIPQVAAIPSIDEMTNIPTNIENIQPVSIPEIVASSPQPVEPVPMVQQPVEQPTIQPNEMPMVAPQVIPEPVQQVPVQQVVTEVVQSQPIQPVTENTMSMTLPQTPSTPMLPRDQGMVTQQTTESDFEVIDL